LKQPQKRERIFEMKDAEGTELVVGDIVVYSRGTYGSQRRALVVEVKETTGTLCYNYNGFNTPWLSQAKNPAQRAIKVDHISSVGWNDKVKAALMKRKCSSDKYPSDDPMKDQTGAVIRVGDTIAHSILHRKKSKLRVGTVTAVFNKFVRYTYTEMRTIHYYTGGPHKPEPCTCRAFAVKPNNIAIVRSSSAQ
jgi:hypothetical protein